MWQLAVAFSFLAPNSLFWVSSPELDVFIPAILLCSKPCSWLGFFLLVLLRLSLQELWHRAFTRELVSRTSSFPGRTVLWDFFPLSLFLKCVSAVPFGTWGTFQHLIVICKTNFGGGYFFLWEKKFGWMSTSRRKLGPSYFGDHLWFCLPRPFLPKLRHIVSEFLKISISTCSRWGIQKHLLILETLAYSIKILAAVKNCSLKMDAAVNLLASLLYKIHVTFRLHL